MPATRQRTVQVVLAILAALAIALIFWTQQRYPSLTKKLHAGSNIQVKGSISFDALLPVSATMPGLERVGRTAVNWIWTNRFGMYFALPFGAVMMTLLGSGAGAKRFASPAANVLCGTVAGMPLGVCANCATPIGQGLLASGASSRMAVAAMISSPSFNPVVVTMVFLLFPLPLAWGRMLVPALLLILLPFLVQENDRSARILTIPGETKTVIQQFSDFARSFGSNLLRLFLLTLPWMILAAVLGAIMVELIPAYGTHLSVSVLGVAGVALVGTLLPVPMALDVALAFVLYRSGVPMAYVVTLLCTLGPLSIYSLAALAQQLGRRAALRAGGALVALGWLAGCIAIFWPAGS